MYPQRAQLLASTGGMLKKQGGRVDGHDRILPLYTAFHTGSHQTC